MSRALNLIGEVFGNLTVVRKAGTNKWGNISWECACACGNTVVVSGGKLQSGQQSCSCIKKGSPIGELTQKKLKEILHYNKDTGVFTWKVDRGLYKCKGKEITYKNSNGYVCVHIDGTLYYAHRLAFLYMEGYIPEYEIDHKDRVRHHNWWDNLRHVTKKCNAHNVNLRSTNKSGITGVHYSKKQGKWVANATCRKVTYLGQSESKLGAALLRYTWEQWEGYECANSRILVQFLRDEGMNVMGTSQ